VEPRQLLRSLGASARSRHWAAIAEAPARAEFWLSLMEACVRGANELRRADDPWMALEVILLRAGAARLPSQPSATEPPPPISASPPPAEAPVAEAPTPADEPQPVADRPAPERPASSPPAALDPLAGAASPLEPWQARWAEVKEWAQQSHPGPFAALVRETRAASLQDGRLRVEVAYPWHLGQLQQAANRALLEAGCREILGPDLSLELALLGAAPAADAPAAPAASKRELSAVAMALQKFPGSTVRKVDFHDPGGAPSIDH
jgi:hypothetical protein